MSNLISHLRNSSPEHSGSQSITPARWQSRTKNAGEDVDSRESLRPLIPALQRQSLRPMWFTERVPGLSRETSANLRAVIRKGLQRCSSNQSVEPCRPEPRRTVPSPGHFHGHPNALWVSGLHSRVSVLHLCSSPPSTWHRPVLREDLSLHLLDLWCHGKRFHVKSHESRCSVALAAARRRQLFSSGTPFSGILVQQSCRKCCFFSKNR